MDPRFAKVKPYETKMKTVLVTGGAGFIGFHLTKKLLEDENTVVLILDNFSNTKRDKDFLDLLEQYRDRVVVLEGNLCFDLPRFGEELSKVTHVYHFAAIRATKTSLYGEQDPFQTLWQNVLTTKNLLDFFRNRAGSPPKFFFASSGETQALQYERYPLKETDSVGVPDTLDPRWTYALSKIAGEMLVINSGLPYIVGRMQNPYGPRAGGDNLLPKMIKRILDGEKVLEVSTPNDTRPFTYIDDLISGLVFLMQEAESGIYNVCSPLEVRIIDVVNALVNAAAVSDVQVVIPENANLEGERRSFDITKIKSLGWEPEDDLVDGLWKTFEWYKENYVPKKAE